MDDAMLMNKTTRVTLRTFPCPVITSTSLLMFLFFHSTRVFFLEIAGETGRNGKQCDFQCEEIANDFSGTRIISLSGKREKKGTAANYRRKAGDTKRDPLMASDWVTEGDPAGTMGDRCPLIGTDRRKFPPFVGPLLFLS
ncbi:hypothetical protein CDAR_551361 [Caerostris darwini]|uniref:Uncharacterized protein n=1 Tax=Caerostris darwini TaxID=1538125 RepID=A0AAV4V6D4_9ARAC|nr:hypothetical protein CDAR_551361 [Caerostris darwini]